MSDEKRAFEAMMAEVEDSDSDNDDNNNKRRNYKSTNKRTSDSKLTTNNNQNNNNNNNSNISSNSNLYSSNNNNENNNNNNKAQPKDSNSNSNILSKEDQDIMNFGEKQNKRETVRSSLNTTSPISKNWLLRPCPPDDPPMKCFVERDRPTFGSLSGGTIYRVYLEVGNDASRAKFLMSAKKILNKRTSYYLVSTEMDPGDDRGSDDLLGKVRANAVGSRYLLTDHGLAPDKSQVPSMHRKEFGVIRFDFDSDGPSQIQAWIPSVNQRGIPVIWQPDSEEGSIESSIERNDYSKLLALKNKKPKWDESHGGHVLNFQGRVTESSVKNFQLICEAVTGDDVTLQFGRVGKHKFTMDVKYPLSPYQAFGMCVACMDGKIADRKGYEFVKKITETLTLSDSKK